MSFGANLKQFRTENGLSQEELAQKIGVHANHLSRYERDVASPSIEVVEKISLALDVSIDRLVFGKESDVEGVVTDKELISLFKKVQLLNDKQKDTVKDFLSAFVLKMELKDKLA